MRKNSTRQAMDPDRYQMRSIKRQIVQLEKAMVRAETRIRSLAAASSEYQRIIDHFILKKDSE